MSKKTRISPKQIMKKKKSGERITMLTAYDYPMASVLDLAGVDMILVGDSVANVVLGLESTREVGMDQMLHHAKAVSRGVKNALVIGDMPFGSFHEDLDLAISNAGRFVEEADCDAVKLEWCENLPEISEAIVQSGIPVMGHVGLTPQAITEKSGFKVQGKLANAAKVIIDQAKALEDKGCFSIVLECIPKEVAKIITEEAKIPTIGIGAGPDCDGQVLVTHDLIGFFDRYRPKFVKQYADLNTSVRQAVEQYSQEVKGGQFPAAEHCFTMPSDELNALKSMRR